MTDLKVVPLLKAKANTNVVSMLEELLTRARAGEVLSLAMAFEAPDGGTGHAIAIETGSDVHRLLGGLARCQHAILQRHG